VVDMAGGSDDDVLDGIHRRGKFCGTMLLEEGRAVKYAKWRSLGHASGDGRVSA
jgi:hypothetical protein